MANLPDPYHHIIKIEYIIIHFYPPTWGEKRNALRYLGPIGATIENPLPANGETI